MLLEQQSKQQAKSSSLRYERSSSKSGESGKFSETGKMCKKEYPKTEFHRQGMGEGKVQKLVMQFSFVLVVFVITASCIYIGLHTKPGGGVRYDAMKCLVAAPGRQHGGWGIVFSRT